MANVTTKDVTYEANGTQLKGQLAIPAQPNGAAVVVVHEWWGVNDYIRGRATKLAELGYTALAADMYGDGQTAGDPAGATKLMTAALGDVPALEARFRAACALLGEQAGVQSAKLAAIGYCFGGAVVLHAARVGMPLKGVVSFHGSLGSFHKPAPGSVKAQILVCHGAEDALVPQKDIDNFKAEMDAAKASYEFKSYPSALHGFTNPEATEKGKKYGLPLAYDAKTDTQSWQDMQSLFNRIF